MGYSFKPMMAVYGRFVTAPTAYLLSADGRRLMAKAIRLCRNQYGKVEGQHFRNALLYAGCIYPILRD